MTAFFGESARQLSRAVSSAGTQRTVLDAGSPKMEREQIFTDIYARNTWRDGESVSGRGSSLKATEQLRKDLADFFKTRNIRSILDIPCGDYNWFRAIDHTFDRYVGYDIVKDLMDLNAERYGSPTVQFRHANILETDYESADLALCRDFVIHSSFNDIFAFFANLRRSNVEYILVSQYGNCENKDMVTGNRYRPIDFTQEPFNFPKPEVLIEEDICHMRDTADRHALDPQKPLTKHLAFWRTEDIYRALDHNLDYQVFLNGRPGNPNHLVLNGVAHG